VTEVISRTIGPFVCGEKPAALQYQFLDQNSQPIDLTGYTIKFSYRERSGSPSGQRDATFVNAATGVVQYVWQGDEFPTPGHYQSEFWAGNGTYRLASARIEWTTRAVAASPAPAI
jgi:hypothetical protein